MLLVGLAVVLNSWEQAWTCNILTWIEDNSGLKRSRILAGFGGQIEQAFFELFMITLKCRG